jgi:chaperonin GroES
MIKPVGSRVLVKPDEGATMTKGGLHIPDNATQKPHQGTVISAGDGKVLPSGNVVAMEVKAGDRVLYGKYSGTEVVLEGQKLLIMLEDDVLAILTGEVDVQSAGEVLPPGFTQVDNDTVEVDALIP